MKTRSFILVFISLSLAARAFATPPSVVRERASFWLDISQTNCIRWSDGRVTGLCDPRNATRIAQANQPLDATCLQHVAQQPSLEIPAQRWLTFPDTTNIVAAFWVIQTQNPALFLLGRSARTYDFHRNMQTGELWDQRYTSPTILAGATFLNGRRVDGLTTTLPESRALVSLSVPAPVAANTLSCDRSMPSRAGGFRFSELILFTTPLTTNEMLSVERYLSAKWAIADYAEQRDLPQEAPLVTWTDPAAPGVSLPSDEIERQWKTLAYDLTQRERFARFAPETYDAQALILDADRDPLDVLLRRTQALLTDLERIGTPAAFAQQRAALTAFALADLSDRKARFAELLALRRTIAFANPLLDFSELLFIKRDLSKVMEHCCDQFYGQQQHAGGGLFVLTNPFGATPAVRNLLDKQPSLTFGERNKPDAGGGSIVTPAISYDANTIAFAYVAAEGSRAHRSHLDHANNGHWDRGFCYHLFTVQRDGTNLRQLTDGTFNDFYPCFTPAGRIAFISERRGGYLRCGRKCPNFTLFDMLPDGSDIRCLSFHETNEWSPAITHDGMLLWTRWDYVDRHGCTAHHPWITTPDGRNPRPVHGNYSYRYQRADMELDTRPIPNSHCFVSTAAPHHGQAFGSLVIVDPRCADDDAMGPVKRLTPDVGFPESQKGSQSYGTAWPLSDGYFLAAYAPVEVKSVAKRHIFGLYLVDRFGNKELIYRDPKIACLNPIPLRATPRPPIIPEQRFPAVRADQRKPADWQAEARGTGTVTIADIYQSLLPWPKDGTRIKTLRIWQLYPLSVSSEETPHNIGMQIPEGYDSINLARALLGTVPVESDGSVHFVAPSGVELFFQAIDEKGCAVQSMRSATALVPGEQLSCQGCHEPKGNAQPSPKTTPLAMKRKPSTIAPGPTGSNPFSYPLLVQPVLEAKCVQCHTDYRAKNPASKRLPPRLDREVQPFPSHGWMNRPTSYFASYISLLPYGFTSYGAKNDWNSPKFYRTIPGEFGARASKLYPLLSNHHNVQLTDDERQRIVLWLDSVCQFYGVYEREGGHAQLRGEIVQPTLR